MRSPRPVRTCEDIVRDHERTRSPLRARPAKRALLAAGLQRLREQQVELERRRKQQQQRDTAPSGGVAGSPTAASALRRRPLLLLGDRSVSGERRTPLAGGGGGDPYSVVNTVVRRAAAAAAATAAAVGVAGVGGSLTLLGGRRSPSGGRHASPPRPRSPGVSPASKMAWGGEGLGSYLPSPPGQRQQESGGRQRPVAAAVADAQARVHLEAAAAAAVSRGSSPILPPPPRYGAAEDLVLALPPYVVVAPQAPQLWASASPPPHHDRGASSRTGRGPFPTASFPDDDGDVEAEGDGARLARVSRLPHPSLLGEGAPSAGVRPRLAPWELGQQLQESLRK